MTTRKTTKKQSPSRARASKIRQASNTKIRPQESLTKLRLMHKITPEELELLPKLHRDIEVSEADFTDEIMTYRAKWGHGGLGV